MERVWWRTARAVAVATLLSLPCSTGCGPDKHRASANPTASQAPRLVVLLIIDQLPAADFARLVPELRGGLGTIARGGVYYRTARFPFASTYTAPGHAAIATGAAPNTTGILANSWYRRDRKRPVSAVADPTARVLTLDGASRPAGSRGVSGTQLRVDGIGGGLRAATAGRGKSVSVAIKDRGAALALGKKPDLVVWYDPAQAAMITSTAYAKTLPPWLVRLARDKPARRFFDRVWTPSDPARLARLTGGRDDRPGEGAGYGMGATFPYRMADTKPPAKAIRATTFGTELIFDTAIAAIDGEKLGADTVPDVLAISVSSHDYAGHAWGPGSWERMDITLHLDGQVTRLLRHLDRVVGPEHYAVVLTSDHGATPLVEHSQSKGRTARRVPRPELMAAGNKAARAILGPGDWVIAVSASTLFLRQDIPADKRARVLTAVAKAVRAVPGIAYARPTAEISGDCDKHSGVEAMACRSISPRDSGDVYYVAARYHVMTTTYKTGTSHGSPNPEDTDVPLVIYAPGRQPARVHRQTVSMLRVAPTICALMGIPAPASAREPPLK